MWSHILFTTILWSNYYYLHFFQQNFPEVAQLIRTRAKIWTLVQLTANALFISYYLAFRPLHYNSNNYILTFMEDWKIKKHDWPIHELFERIGIVLHFIYFCITLNVLVWQFKHTSRDVVNVQLSGIPCTKKLSLESLFLGDFAPFSNVVSDHESFNHHSHRAWSIAAFFLFQLFFSFFLNEVCNKEGIIVIIVWLSSYHNKRLILH